MGVMDRNEGDRAGSGWRVGELAAATGLTVRALHHYDHVGLLRPSSHTAVGHRRYTEADVSRLYRIKLLRGLGLGLDQIGRVLDDPEWQLAPAMRRHLEETRRRAALEARLAERLADMVDAIDADRHLGAEQLFTTLEDMTMLDTSVHSTTSLLVYDDIAAAHSYLVRVFGLTAGDITTGPDGRVTHAEVRAGQHVIWLHPAGEDYRSPRSVGAVTGMTVINVDDVEAHHAHAVAEGAQIVEEPTDQPYGVREYGARDLEGQLWFFHAPIG